MTNNHILLTGTVLNFRLVASRINFCVFHFEEIWVERIYVDLRELSISRRVDLFGKCIILCFLCVHAILIIIYKQEIINFKDLKNSCFLLSTLYIIYILLLFSLFAIYFIFTFSVFILIWFTIFIIGLYCSFSLFLFILSQFRDYICSEKNYKILFDFGTSRFTTKYKFGNLIYSLQLYQIDYYHQLREIN